MVYKRPLLLIDKNDYHYDLSRLVGNSLKKKKQSRRYQDDIFLNYTHSRENRLQ